ncbi:hypothetical protein [Corynebacterium lowii]|uniref:hypothetical protein n=1 Tax=Corynebacterium lowii TaxID=1544413 RepID=UPI000AA874A0|nr:hypothetical protein [Corynebacterium lowii]MDP9851979.1 hypothetical protein [Corynebacterium lowii]
MEFEEFARRFRERATQRMLEFEVALEQSRRDMEKAARNRKNGGGVAPGKNTSADPPTPQTVLHKHMLREPMARAGEPGQRTKRPVQGVLRKN